MGSIMNKKKNGIRIVRYRTFILGLMLVSVMILTTACGSAGAGGETDASYSEEETMVSRDSEESTEKESETEENADGATGGIETADLEKIAELLGKSDLQAAEAFGGGEENWTEDKSFYIGRIYKVKLFDEEVKVYTTYDDQELVNAVSVWLVNGEREVKEEDSLQWVERLNEFTGTKPDLRDTSSEAGSKNWKWFLGDRAVTLNWLEDMLTISMNVVVGELN